MSGRGHDGERRQSRRRRSGSGATPRALVGCHGGSHTCLHNLRLPLRRMEALGDWGSCLPGGLVNQRAEGPRRAIVRRIQA